MNDTLYDSKNYPDFASQNTGSGLLKVQVFTANQAFPLKDVDITIYKDIDGKRVVFYEGVTDSSGIIDNISLPTKEMKSDVESADDIVFTTYNITAKNINTNETKDYVIYIFNDVKIIQPIQFPITSSSFEGAGE